jgi:GAF domain-containing protein
VVELPPLTPLPAEAVPIFDGFARRVAEQLDVPVALVSLVDVNGQALPGAFGLSEPWQGERWTPLSHSFCQHVVTSGSSLVVANSNDDPLVADNLAVMELGVIAYAGVPLRTGSGPVVGAMCAIDHRPRQWRPAELTLLAGIAVQCSEELGATNGR